MRVGLIDVDSHNFPNLALMKISAHHKARGDDVQWAIPLEHYDVVYQSKVFDDTYSPDIDWQPNADRIVKGGTGYGLDNKLPDEIEHIYPDYSIYPELTEDTAYGFLTRGCPRHCDFCIVGDKEGLRSVKVADLSEFWRGRSTSSSSTRTCLPARTGSTFSISSKQAVRMWILHRGLTSG